jgi:hypothetical protein
LRRKNRKEGTKKLTSSENTELLFILSSLKKIRDKYERRVAFYKLHQSYATLQDEETPLISEVKQNSRNLDPQSLFKVIRDIDEHMDPVRLRNEIDILIRDVEMKKQALIESIEKRKAKSERLTKMNEELEKFHKELNLVRIPPSNRKLIEEKIKIEEINMRTIIEYETTFKRKNPIPKVVDKPPIPVKSVEETEMMVEKKGTEDSIAMPVLTINQTNFLFLLSMRTVATSPPPLADVNIENIKDYLSRTPLLIPVDLATLLQKALDENDFSVPFSETSEGTDFMKSFFSVNMQNFYEKMDVSERPRLGMMMMDRHKSPPPRGAGFEKKIGYIELNPEILKTRCTLLFRHKIATFGRPDSIIEQMTLEERQYLSRPFEELKEHRWEDRRSALGHMILFVAIHGPIRLDRDVVGFARKILIPDPVQGLVSKLGERIGKIFKTEMISHKISLK